MRRRAIVACALVHTVTLSASPTPAAPSRAVQTQVPGCKCVMNLQHRTEHSSIMAMPRAPSDMTPVAYPSHYGESCKKHLEPGVAACSHTNGTEKKVRAKWCDASWCFVDPCTCKEADISASTYFPKSNLHYSYSNCGTTDNYTAVQSSIASCPAGNFTPQNVCATKMDNRQPKFKCSAAFAESGKCVHMNVSSTMKTYPGNYGEGCGIHGEPAFPECSNPDGTPKPTDQQAVWCRESWSYVNPCSCNISDIAKSGFSSPDKPMFYSYAACGAADHWTKTPFDKSELLLAGCPSPAPPPALVQNPFNYPSSATTNCHCQKAKSPTTNCTTEFAQNGQCQIYRDALFPLNYGESCGIQYEAASAACTDPATGRPWPSRCDVDTARGCRAAWCDEPWCLVDPCTCTETDVNMVASPHGPRYYSYRACGGRDLWSTGTEKVQCGKPDLHANEEDACPWLVPHSGPTSMPLCSDGTFAANWKCYGTRLQCPADHPHMCADHTCGAGKEHCCSADCSTHGGDRPCGATAPANASHGHGADSVAHDSNATDIAHNDSKNKASAVDVDAGSGLNSCRFAGFLMVVAAGTPTLQV